MNGEHVCMVHNSWSLWLNLSSPLNVTVNPKSHENTSAFPESYRQQLKTFLSGCVIQTLFEDIGWAVLNLCDISVGASASCIARRIFVLVKD